MGVSHFMATIKFMRLSKMCNIFLYLAIDEKAIVPVDDSKTKLLEPKICNKTKRERLFLVIILVKRMSY